MSIGLDFQNPDVLYIHVAFDGLLRSTDRGATWTNVTGDLNSLVVSEITADPGPSNRVLVSTERGILASEAGGGSWLTTHAGINAQGINTFSMSDDGVFAASRAAVFVPHGSDSLVPLDVDGLFAAVEIRSTGIGLASLGSAPGTQVLGEVGGRIARSDNGGLTWRALAGLPADVQVQVMAASRGNPATVLAVGVDDRLFRSADDGDTWQDITGKLPQPLTISEIQFARSQPTIAYLAVATPTPPGGGPLSFGLLKTQDGGVTFSVVQPVQGTSGFDSLTIDPTNAQTVYAELGTGISKSSDGGATWISLPLPPMDWPEIRSIQVDPVRPKIISVATTFAGLRSVNGGRTWSILGPVGRGGDSNIAITSDPARPGTVRVGTALKSIQQLVVSPDVAITATSMPDTLPINAPVTIMYSVSNLGPFDASEVAAVLRLPINVQDVRASMTDGTCSTITGRVMCTTDALLLDQPQTIAVSFMTAAGGAFTVNAEVAASEPDTDRSNNSVARTSNVTELADLLVSLEGTQSATPGAALTYRVSAMNRGPNQATGVRIDVQLANGLTLIRVDSQNITCGASIRGTVTCNVGTLESGQSAALGLHLTAQNAGTFQSTAQVSGSGSDPSADNNGTQIITTVMAMAAPPPNPAPGPMRSGGGSMAPALLCALLLVALLRAATSRSRRACGKTV